MIRPNLRSLAAAVACLSSASAIAVAQEGYYGDPSANCLPHSTYQGPIQDHYIRGNTELWDENRPIERLLTDVADRSWLKLEFLMWNADGEHDHVGAPVTGLQRNSRGELEGHTIPVPLVDNLNGGTADTGEALFPNATMLGTKDIPGVRGTWGLDLNGGDIELSFFGLAQSGSGFMNDDLSAARIRVGSPGDPALGTFFFPNVAVPLLTNDNPSPVADVNALIFNESFSENLETQMWGSEFLLLTDRQAPGGVGPSWQWLGGFRYVNVDEAFAFAGTSIAQPGTSVVSTTINNFYGPELGARLALTSKYFTVSATPRIMLGINDNSGTVASVITGVPGTTHNYQTVDFGTVTQVNLSTEVHLSPQFSMYGGYDFMVFSNISRPFDNVHYNSVTDPLGARTADIGQRVNLQDMVVNGFNIGAVFRY